MIGGIRNDGYRQLYGEAICNNKVPGYGILPYPMGLIIVLFVQLWVKTHRKEQIVAFLTLA